MVTARYSLEDEVLRICRSVLDDNSVGLDDDLYGHGLSSLRSVEIAGRIHRLTGYKLPLGAVLSHATVASLTVLLRGSANNSSYAVWFPGADPSPRWRVVCPMSLGGSVSRYFTLSRALGKEFQVVGLQAAQLAGACRGFSSVEEAAQEFLDELALPADLPIALAGYSFGGLIAYEMARRLSTQRDGVAPALVLIDSFLDDPDHEPGTSAATALVRAILRLTPPPGWPPLNQVHSFDELWDLIATAHALPRGVGKDELSLIYDVVRDNSAAAGSYVAPPSDLSALLIRSTGEPEPEADLGWNKVLREVTVVQTDVTHWELLESKGVTAVADAVRSRLAAAAP